jgi:hypothetical protein
LLSWSRVTCTRKGIPRSHTTTLSVGMVTSAPTDAARADVFETLDRSVLTGGV